MGAVVALYEALTSAPDDRARARVIAEAFGQVEERYPAIERSRNSLLLWLIPLMFAQVGAIAALVKLL